MTTLSASSSRPADAGYAAAATLVAVVLFLFSWALLHRGFFAHDPIVDTPVYERYGSAIDSGQVPYRDFALEYPPGALPVFVLPALGGAHGDSYRRRFEALMALLGELMLVTVAVALAALGAGRRWLLAALGLAAVAPLLLGPVVLSRFDLWPAALTAIALAALAGDRLRLGPPRARCGGRGEALRGRAGADRPRVRLAAEGEARGARLRRAAPGRGRDRVRPVPRRCAATASGTASGTRPLARCRSRASARGSCSSRTTSSGPA